MIRIVIILTLMSCGKPDTNCIGANEARLRCNADAASRWYPAQTPQYEANKCDSSYPLGGCY